MNNIQNVITKIRSIIQESCSVKEYCIKELDYIVYCYVCSYESNDYTIGIIFKTDDIGQCFLQPIQCNINYNLLDNIVNTVLSKVDLEPKIDYRNRWGSFFYEFITKNDPILLSKYNVDDFSVKFNNEILPFIDNWKDLKSLYEYIKNKEGREELDPILGQFWQFKKATILRLCNDENYQDYMDSFVERRKMILEKRSDSIDVQRYYNAAKQLKEVLDKTVPIYNV